MPRAPLDKALRNHLENVVDEARNVAESAAYEALNQLGVGDAVAPAHLDEASRALRNRLRAHGRQLGDVRSDSGQELTALKEEIAYEHWHRMLFARFLAENGLLLYDGVPITLADCADLAEEEHYDSPWTLAAECATKMLPQIFRLDSPSFEIRFASDKMRQLENLLASLENDVFQASDAIGWLYQFWQTKRKKQINESEVKIGAKELPAVTQLFTEPYMVSFLLDNSLGAWYAAPKLEGNCFETEAEAKASVSTTDIPLTYLRLVQNDDKTWKPAGGTFEGWPKSLSEFTLLDPCCGSGHFLVSSLLMLVPMRMELEGMDAHDAVDVVLSQNLHGLELDGRCVELAAFAVALEAWRYPNAGGYRPLPPFHLACDGVAPQMKRDEWIRLARLAARNLPGGDASMLMPEVAEPSLWENQLVQAMGRLYDVFQDAPVLGSLINPTQLTGDLFTASYADTVKILQENLGVSNDDAHEAAIAAQGIVKAMELLQKKYTLVITNPPYLAIRRQNELLQQYCEKIYKDARYDIATVFITRCLEFCQNNGTVNLVLPQNWLFLTSYRRFREFLLRNYSYNFITILGAGAFDTISGEIVKAILFSFNHNYSQNNHHFFGINVSETLDINNKSTSLKERTITLLEQLKQLSNADSRIIINELSSQELLNKYAEGLAGILNGDSPHFLKVFWELPDRNGLWSFQQTTVENTVIYGGLQNLVFYDEENGHLREDEWIRRERLHNSDQRGQSVVGKQGIGVSSMGNLPVAKFVGARFDSNVAAVVPDNSSILPALWCYCSSPEYYIEIRKIDQTLKVTNATLVKVPFDLEYWTKVAAEKYPYGLPEPFTDDPTQWLFHGHPCGSVVWNDDTKRLAIGEDRMDSTVLHVAVARLLGYRWPAELDDKMELAVEMRQVMTRNEELLPLADNDGIVCIPPVRGELDTATRLQNLLAAAYGENWNASVLGQLLAANDCSDRSLDYWLRNKFFLQHTKLFGNRPFIWHIWDGLPDGFAVLVNYHKLNYKALENLIYNYLGDWITRQKSDVARGIDGAQEKLDAAETLKTKLLLILAGEAPYDIFIRWKTLAQQPIGWNPDLNDGVRLNIRPFVLADVLREKQAKLNIKWEKDRGKDVASAPWYHVFHGDRINDHHLTLAEKNINGI